MVGPSRSGESFLKESSCTARFISHPHRYAVWNKLNEFRALAADTRHDQRGNRGRRERARGDLSCDPTKARRISALPGIQPTDPGGHRSRCLRGCVDQDQFVAQPWNIRSLVLGHNSESSPGLATLETARRASTGSWYPRGSHTGRNTRIQRGPLRHSVGARRTIGRRPTPPVAPRDRGTAVQSDRFNHRRFHGDCESPLPSRTTASGNCV